MPLRTQRLFARRSVGIPINPLQVVAKFLTEQAKSNGNEVEGLAKNVGLTMLFPGNMMQAAWVHSPLNTTASAPEWTVQAVSSVWDRGFEIATRRTSFLKKLEGQELLLAGSWCCIFGAIVSVMAGRQHFLTLLGMGLFGYGAMQNKSTLTLQYGLAAVCVVFGIVKGHKNRMENTERKVKGRLAGEKVKEEEGKKTD